MIIISLYPTIKKEKKNANSSTTILYNNIKKNSFIKATPTFKIFNHKSKNNNHIRNTFQHDMLQRESGVW